MPDQERHPDIIALGHSDYLIDQNGDMIYYGVKRHRDWPRKRDEILKLSPACIVCGRSDELDVHHIQPYHERPDLELVNDNLCVLCGGDWNHHFWFGHLGSWKSWNLRVREDAAWFRRRMKCRP